MRSFIFAFSLGFVVLGASDTSRAQTDSTEPSVVEQVEAHNAKGVAHYQKGEFPEAIAEMLKAYHLMPEPALLFNVAKIYQKMNESALAEKYYRKFIEEDEADPEKVKEALAQISAIQEAQKKQTAEAQAEKEKAAALEQEQQALAEKAAAKKRAEDEANATCLPCWLASGMTVGTVGVASAMGYLALEERKIFDTTFAASQRQQASQNSIQYALLSDIAWGASGAIAVTAGVLFFRHAQTASAVKEEQE